MTKEQRRFARIGVPMTIEVQVDGQATLELETADISNGGVFLKASPGQCLPVGTELALRVKGQLGGQEPPLVKARVVRATDTGMGVEFI